MRGAHFLASVALLSATVSAAAPFATVRITQSKPENAVMIPVAAVRTEGETNRVFIIKDGMAREQFVQLGLLENDMIQVKQGVAENDVVATSNLSKLTDGVFVRAN